MNFIEDFIKIAKENSFSPLLISSGCCGLEVINAACSSCDENVIKSETFVNSARQADLLIIAGPVTEKSATSVQRIYKQMPEPKYVVAIGNCACSGGLFAENSYSVVAGADKILPVDVFLPMCPPQPNMIYDAINLLKNKIAVNNPMNRF